MKQKDIISYQTGKESTEKEGSIKVGSLILLTIRKKKAKHKML